jgi:hypothetical protein
MSNQFDQVHSYLDKMSAKANISDEINSFASLSDEVMSFKASIPDRKPGLAKSSRDQHPHPLCGFGRYGDARIPVSAPLNGAARSDRWRGSGQRPKTIPEPPPSRQAAPP